ACRPHQARTERETSLGADHGKAQAQDPGHVYSLPRRYPRWTTYHDNDGVVTGEPDAQKVSTSGSAGGRWKRAYIDCRYLASGLPDPKKNGKKRPLGLPSWSDKLVGEVVRLL